MAERKTNQQEMTALHQLVQDIIGGGVRRNTFMQWELELLLDLQTCQIRKGSRPEILRRYVRAVQQHFAQGATAPLRLAAFLDRDNQRAKSVAETPAKSAEIVTGRLAEHALVAGLSSEES
jgi:hypothetical protein